mmetsp:Transcript_9024/g.26985  ORF Transcript_9024/g.26985 Transcript_9024/m.26985 type:complete len:211 (-) Transcript_9024:476-1108(-)
MGCLRLAEKRLRKRAVNNCLIWAAGRATFDAILYSCHCFLRSSPPQSAFQDTLPPSEDRSRSFARAPASPRRCCSSAMAVTSSTPAGTSAAARPASDFVRVTLDSHHWSVPMAPAKGAAESSSMYWESPDASRAQYCDRLVSSPPENSRFNWAEFGMPSATERKPVRPNFRVHHNARVFHGVVRPFRGCSPASNVCPSSTGPTTSVSEVK